jgi:hypothetical protein
MLLDAPYVVLWHNFLIYARTSSAQTGLFLPLLLACVGLLVARRHRLAPMTGVLFLVGLLITVQFSLFLERDGTASLYCAPGCLLVMMLSPPQVRPHWGHGYALCFLGEITADLWCTVRHFLEQGPLRLDFFFGIGGAGLKDGLFIYPLMAAIFLAADHWLRTTHHGQLTISEVVQALRTRIEANGRKRSAAV